jgi:hypothetical protein
MAETRACADCQQQFLVNEHGWLVVPFFEMHSTTCERCGKPLHVEYTDDGLIHYHCSVHMSGVGPALFGYSEKYCPRCREERRKKNRQAYPPCPMCGTPTRVWDFLKRYQGYTLDSIRVCCKSCIPRFEALAEAEQLALLRQTMVKTYGETAVIYALQYDDHFPCQHIGRTKHYDRRMAEYKRNWHIEIKHHFILEELSFGPLAMEREARWILHALKHRWPIDNFELLKGIDRRGVQARLTEAVQSVEPLTAPFETVLPLITGGGFLNVADVGIAHWFFQRHTPSEIQWEPAGGNPLS